MTQREEYDAIVIGSGPNGLAAAIEMGRAGLSTLVIEARDSLGGGTRTAELTLPGFAHDVCSAVHPLGVGSPFFRSVPLDQYGLTWAYPTYGLAHPFDDGTAAVLHTDLEVTGASLGEDGRAYQRLMQPYVADWQELMETILGPLPLPPRRPVLLARFGLSALLSARGLAFSRFKGQRARTLFAGMAAHSILPLDQMISASFGMVLGLLGHVTGWPVAVGGSQQISQALAGYLRSLGGETAVNWQVRSLKELNPSRAVFFDLVPKQMVEIAGEILPGGYRKALGRYRHGPGIFKVDWALSEAAPWQAPECRQAGTIHLGGSFEEIERSEAMVWKGQVSDRPYVIYVQPTVADPSRAPQGRHIGWGYCHVPNGSTEDCLERIEAQIERFAPGFKDCILSRHVIYPDAVEAYNPNYIGGDIAGGATDIWQLFTRPTWNLQPYMTPVKRLYICSAATPPGGGVHGMAGYHAARAALKRSFS